MLRFKVQDSKFNGSSSRPMSSGVPDNIRAPTESYNIIELFTHDIFMTRHIASFPLGSCSMPNIINHQTGDELTISKPIRCPVRWVSSQQHSSDPTNVSAESSRNSTQVARPGHLPVMRKNALSKSVRRPLPTFRRSIW